MFKSGVNIRGSKFNKPSALVAYYQKLSPNLHGKKLFTCRPGLHVCWGKVLIFLFPSRMDSAMNFTAFAQVSLLPICDVLIFLYSVCICLIEIKEMYLLYICEPEIYDVSFARGVILTFATENCSIMSAVTISVGEDLLVGS